MATTNFLTFDAPAQNCESDTAYLGDASRTGGFDVNAIVTSALLNKVFLQFSQMVCGLATMLQNKGFSTSDSNFPMLVNALSNIVTTADGKQPLLDLLYSPSAVFNTAIADSFQMILTGNLTNMQVTGVAPGTVVTFLFQQDGTGGRTVSYGRAFFNPGPAQPDPTPGRCRSSSLSAGVTACSGRLHTRPIPSLATTNT